MEWEREMVVGGFMERCGCIDRFEEWRRVLFFDVGGYV